jgi:transcriptional regulator with XRE-family HTH domain
MAATFTMRRRRLTAELRRLREASGLTIDEVAARIGLSKSTISRIETGDVELKLPVLRSLMSQYGVADEQAALLEKLTREAAEKGWWHVAGGVRDATKELIGLESEASWVNDFSCSIITGLLQTPDYARAVVRKALPEAPERDWESAIEVRLRRQRRLGELRLWVIVTEEALLRPIGSREIMAEQLNHLVKMAAEPKTRIQVLPLGAGAHAALGGNFAVIGFEPTTDPEVVYVEGHRWDACIEETDQVEIYKRSFQELTADAVSFENSVATLRHRSEELTGGN